MGNQKKLKNSKKTPLKQEQKIKNRVLLNEKVQKALSDMQILLNITKKIQSKITETVSFSVDLGNCSLDVRESTLGNMSKSNKVLINAINNCQELTQSEIKMLTQDGYSTEEIKALFNYFGFKKQNYYRTDPNLMELGKKMRTGANDSFHGIQREIDRIDFSLFTSAESHLAFDERKANTVVDLFNQFMKTAFQNVRTNLATGASAETMLLERGVEENKLLEFIETIDGIRKTMGSKANELREKENALKHTIQVIRKNINDPDKVSAIVDLLDTGGTLQDLYKEAIQVEEVNIEDIGEHNSEAIDYAAELKKRQAIEKVQKLEKKLAKIQKENARFKLKVRNKKKLKEENAKLVAELEDQFEEVIRIEENKEKNEHLGKKERKEYQKALNEEIENHTARKIGFWARLGKWLDTPWNVRWKQLAGEDLKKK
jgi:hypothetical protein